MSEQTTKKTVGGIIPAIITPFHENGTIDFPSLEKQTRYLIDNGAHGLFVNGTTGEGAYLTTTDKIEIYKAVKEIAEGKVILCAACLQPSTDMVLSEMKAHAKYGPDYYVAVTPYYYNSSQEATINHFKTIAKAAEAPLIVYHIPSRTHNDISVESVLELLDVANIAGIKDSSANFVNFSRCFLAGQKEGFAWIQGDDLLDAPSLLMGANGIVTGLSNIWIDPYKELYLAALKKDVPAAYEAQKHINYLFNVIKVTNGKVGPSIKAAIEILGRGKRTMKQASLTLSDEEVQKVEGVLKDMGLV